MFIRIGQNSSACKEKIRIPVSIRKGPEFQCLEEKDQNSSVWKDKIRIPIFITIGREIQRLKGQGQNSNVLQGWHQNSNVWDNRTTIPVFTRITSEVRSYKQKGQNFTVWKDRARTLMFIKKKGQIKIGQEFQCLKNGQNSNV